jgi:hypothetical protein
MSLHTSYKITDWLIFNEQNHFYIDSILHKMSAKLHEGITGLFSVKNVSSLVSFSGVMDTFLKTGSTHKQNNFILLYLSATQ